jgi:hypothetical protein
VHVRDLDPVDRALAHAERERGARVVGVDVDLERGVVADDEERVAEPLQLLLEAVRVEALALDDEDRAVAVLRQLLVDGVDAELLDLHGRVGERLAAHGCGDPAQELEQARAAGVDHARLAQHVEQLGRARQRLLALGDELGQQLVDAELRVGLPLGRLGEAADHRQHRPLDGLPHGAVGRVARAPERTRGEAGVDGARVGEHLGGAADDLAQDHARVPPRRHERRTRELVRQRRAVAVGTALERLDDAADGEREVRPRVPVGYRVDVEVVDPAPIRLEGRERAVGEAPDGGELAHFDRLTSSMCTSTAATRRPVRRETSYATRERIVVPTSARLRPYSTTTCRSMRSPSGVPLTAIPRVGRSGRSLPIAARGAIATTP